MRPVRNAFCLLFAVVVACRSQDKAPEPAAASPSAAAPSTPASVTMTSEAINAAGVTTAKVTSSTIQLRSDVPGSIEAPRDALVIVNTRAAGVVESLDFDVGDRVGAGQRLATVRSLELAEAQVAYRRAVLAEKYAAAALERTTALHSDGVVPEKRVQVDQLEAHERKLGLEETAAKVRILGGVPGGEGGLLTIVAPINGTIASRSANRGQALDNNSPLYTIVDVSQVVVQLRAPAGTPVEPGAQVAFDIDALPGRHFIATVKSGSDLLDPETRRFLIRCSVDNGDGVLKPGMFVTAKVPGASVQAITVAEPALQVMPDGPAVFVVEGGGKFTRRSVILGARADGKVAVERGLAEGEEIVVQGSFWVRTQLQKSELEE
jgi:cobalt-zinc-cadmium efflux system membrane fusion protein